MKNRKGLPEAYRNRHGQKEQEMTAPATAIPKVDYKVYRKPFRWCPGGKPESSFSPATFMLEFRSDNGKPWGEGSLYIDPWAMAIVEAPFLRIFGQDYSYYTTQISRAECEDIVRSWTRMLADVKKAQNPDDLFLAFNNPCYGRFEDAQWSRREEIETMLMELIEGLMEILGDGREIWLKGL